MKQGMSPKISPDSGSQDIPVNTVMYVRFEGSQFVHDSQLENEENFLLTTCASKTAKPKTNTDSDSLKDTEPKSTTDSDNKDSKQESKPQKSKDPNQTTQSSFTRGKAVPGFLHWEKSTGKNDTGETVKVTKIFFFPKKTLKANERYCFSVAGLILEGEERDITPAKTVSFRTEKRPIFRYDSTPEYEFHLAWDPSYVEDKEDDAYVSPEKRDLVAVLFSFDREVDPDVVLKNIFRCRERIDTTSQSSTTDTSCGDRGFSESFKFELLETLQKDPKRNLYISSSNTFLVTGAPIRHKENKFNYALQLKIGDLDEEIDFQELDANKILSWQGALEEIETEDPVRIPIRSR